MIPVQNQFDCAPSIQTEMIFEMVRPIKSEDAFNKTSFWDDMKDD